MSRGRPPLAPLVARRRGPGWMLGMLWLLSGCLLTVERPDRPVAAADTRQDTEGGHSDSDTDSHVDSDPDSGSNVDLPTFEAEHGIDLILLSAGSFTMGSPEEERGHGYSTETQVEVTLTQDFYLSSVEVTQGLYRDFTGTNPSLFPTCGDDCPVDMITWHDAARFVNSLSAAAGLDLCYTCDGAGCVASGDPYICSGYRLPTEAEWEYAARAGTTSAFHNGGNLLTDQDLYQCGSPVILDNGASLADIAHYCVASVDQTYPVAGLEANAWGLYDMSGNVWEWTHDGATPTGEGNLYLPGGTDPVGDDPAPCRVMRGGSWRLGAIDLRSANRSPRDPMATDDDQGFRIARSAEP